MSLLLSEELLPLNLLYHVLELLLSVSLLKHIKEAALVLLSLHVFAFSLSVSRLSLLQLEPLLLLEELLLLLRHLGRLV